MILKLFILKTDKVKMVMSEEIKDIELTLLNINTENYRFEAMNNQRDAITAMINDQKEKLINLGNDIIDNGLNPSDLIIVSSHRTLENQFKVLEGNRRITALKLLHNPNLIPDSHGSLLKRFKELSLLFNKRPIKNIPCVYFDNEEDAKKWIRLKHTGENEGVGTVRWDAQQKRRFESTVGGKTNYALQVIQFLEKDIGIEGDLRNKLPLVPSSSLQRLIGDPSVRNKIGLNVENGIITSEIPPEEVRKPLIKMIEDLADNKISVNDIYYKQNRSSYLETFKTNELPNDESLEEKWQLNDVNIKNKPKKSVRRKALSTNRKYLIPDNLSLKIQQPRINKIFKELKKLDLNNFVNAAAITLRVFIELSLDDYIKKNGIDKDITSDKLVKKVNAVCQYMQDNNILNKNQLKPIRTISTPQDSVGSTNTLNAYVHNMDYNPTATDLKTTWDNLASFFTKIWEK